MKKNPVTAIQQAIEEEEKEQQPHKVRQYTIIVIVCCVLNLLVLPMSRTEQPDNILNDTEIPTIVEESLEDLESKIEELDTVMADLSDGVASPSAVKTSFEKKMGKSIELIVERLSEVENSLDSIVKDVNKIRKGVVALEQKQIEIKEKMRKNK